MPRDMTDYRVPKFVKPKPLLPFGESAKDKFMKFEEYPRNYRGRDGNPGFPQGGYDPRANSPTVKDIKLDVDELSPEPWK